MELPVDNANSLIVGAIVALVVLGVVLLVLRAGRPEPEETVVAEPEETVVAASDEMPVPSSRSLLKQMELYGRH